MKNKKFSINIGIFLLLLYTIFIILNDYICFFAKVDAGIITYFLSGVIVLIAAFFLKNKITLKKELFERNDILFFSFILIIWLCRLVFPESAFDTLNYHLYLQERPFTDHINFDFFPARWINTFSLPLADRMHYFFRFLFGYRLGMIANLLILIVIYYQVKRILKLYLKNNKFISIFALIVIITEQILSNMTTYYVDLFSIPFFLEIILIIIENRGSKLNNYLVLFMSGIIVSLKISNAFLLIPLAIIYIYKYYKYINWKTFVFGIIVVFIPLCVYLINNYIQTGNPVFPFYNSIFKSSYLAQENWIEDAYGPKNLIERLFWPIYTIFVPRRAFDTDVYYGRIGFGYIVSIIIVITAIYNYLKNKTKIQKEEKFALLYIILCLIWSNFMMGYIRYVLVLEVMSGIILVIFLYKYFKAKNWIMYICSILVIFSFIYQITNTIHDMTMDSYELSWRLPYLENQESYYRNFEHLFNRKWDYSKFIKDVDCFAVTDYNSGYATLLSSDKKIIGLNESYQNKYGEKVLDKQIKQCKNLYTISTSVTLDRTLNYVKTLGFKQKGEIRETKADFLNIDYDLYLFEIEKDS